MRRAVIVMAKRPRPGEVKTRLIPRIGPAAAAGLYRAMLLDVLDSTAALPRTERFLFVHPAESVGWFEEAAAPRFSVRPQAGENLAERMIAAFDALFRESFSAVVMRNSDSPTLPGARIEEAFAALQGGADLVLGPDLGGGYYLAGLRAPHPDLFRGVAMGGSSVFEETQRRAKLYRLRVHLLVPWLDVDTPDDLARLREQLDPGRRVERALCERTEAFLASLAVAGAPDASGRLGRIQQGIPTTDGARQADGKDDRAGDSVS